MPIDETTRNALVEVVREFQDRVTVHADQALDALELAEDDKELTAELISLELRRAELHASLALGVRVDLLTTLLITFALPEHALDLIGYVEGEGGE